jgi:hypothetical protein
VRGAAAYAGIVWNWLRKQETPEPVKTLRGAPLKPRLKTYSAESGYVYQYVYRGYRSAPVPDGPRSKQYVFSVSRDRKNYFPVFVVLAEQVVSSWCAAHQRVLSETELYAIAKLSLFEALDQRQEVAELGAPIEISGDAIERHLAALGRL